jgi:DeoR/GlpR family transcriptional regulator of sugar metabolism
MALLPPQRRQLILKDIYNLGAGLVTDLSEKYGVSEMTIRRDLMALEEEGYVQRTHGGAIRQPAPPDVHVLAREKRVKLFAAQKTAIAHYAATHLVADSDIVILEGGTTVTAMIPFLAEREDLTVVTNGLYATNELQRHLRPSSAVICAGGILRKESSTFVGPVAERFFREFHANKLFLSATGLTLPTGVTDPNMVETQVKRAMVASASKVFVLLDSSKFGVKSLMTVALLDEVSLLITDDRAPGETLQALGAQGVNVHVVANS